MNGRATWRTSSASPGTPEEINAAIVERMLARYGEAPPLIPGAAGGGARGRRALAARDRVVVEPGADRGRPARRRAARALPGRGVVAGGCAREAGARRLPRSGATAWRSIRALCAAVEDSHNGIRSAKAAGMRVVAIPNPHFPPDDESLAQADVIVRSVAELTPDLLAG